MPNGLMTLELNGATLISLPLVVIFPSPSILETSALLGARVPLKRADDGPNKMENRWLKLVYLREYLSGNLLE